MIMDESLHSFLAYARDVAHDEFHPRIGQASEQHKQKEQHENHEPNEEHDPDYLLTDGIPFLPTLYASCSDGRASDIIMPKASLAELNKSDHSFKMKPQINIETNTATSNHGTASNSPSKHSQLDQPRSQTSARTPRLTLNTECPEIKFSPDGYHMITENDHHESGSSSGKEWDRDIVHVTAAHVASILLHERHDQASEAERLRRSLNGCESEVASTVTPSPVDTDASDLSSIGHTGPDFDGYSVEADNDIAHPPVLDNQNLLDNQDTVLDEQVTAFNNQDTALNGEETRPMWKGRGNMMYLVLFAMALAAGFLSVVLGGINSVFALGLDTRVPEFGFQPLTKAARDTISAQTFELFKELECEIHLKEEAKDGNRHSHSEQDAERCQQLELLDAAFCNVSVNEFIDFSDALATAWTAIYAVHIEAQKETLLPTMMFYLTRARPNEWLSPRLMRRAVLQNQVSDLQTGLEQFQRALAQAQDEKHNVMTRLDVLHLEACGKPPASTAMSALRLISVYDPAKVRVVESLGLKESVCGPAERARHVTTRLLSLVDRDRAENTLRHLGLVANEVQLAMERGQKTEETEDEFLGRINGEVVWLAKEVLQLMAKYARED